MKNRDTVCIGDIYGKMLNSLRYTLKESKAKTFPGQKVELVGDGPKVSGYNEVDGEYTGKKGTKKNKGKRLNMTKAVNEVGEEDEEDKKPSSVEKRIEKLQNAMQKPNISDSEKAKIKKQLDSLTNESEERLQESKKITNKSLNNFMSKSVFDKLYSKVLRENFGQDEGDDLDALGLDDATSDSEMDDGMGGEDMGEEGGDEVTFTLPRDVAQQLCDVLQAAIGGGEEGFGDEGEDDGLDFGDEGEFGGEEDNYGEEDEEVQGTKVAPDKKKVFQAKSNQVAGPPKPKHTKAKGDVTDDVGTTETTPPITALQGKSNQVPSAVKVGDYFK